MTPLLALMTPPPPPPEPTQAGTWRQLRPGSLEWDRAWCALAAHAINAQDTDCADPETGERWQYMGTVEGPDGCRHEFRHRHHPRTGQRETLAILPFRRPSTDPDSYRSATP